VSGDIKDHQDGTFSQTVQSDPNSAASPGGAAAESGAPPVTLGEPLLLLFSYSVKFVCGRQQECPCGCAPVVPGLYATEINIHNHNSAAAPLIKLVIPLVLAGAVIGREPKIGGFKAFDRIDLPPHSATMDDCCRISELLLGAPAPATAALAIGILEIISLRELSVSAVYTVSNPLSGSVDIDVKQIATRFVPLGTAAADATHDLRKMFASKPQ
jgi:hypothetical protein